jgi:hypothetical protein
MMKSSLAIFWLIICSTFSTHLFAQQSCPSVSSVKKWEVISGDKVLAYDNSDNYYFFMTLGCSVCAGKAGGPVTLRFFSSTICNGDNVIVNGFATRVSSLEGVRR